MTKEELERTWAPSPTPAPRVQEGTENGRTSTSSASSAWASTPPSWSPTRSPSSPGRTAADEACKWESDGVDGYTITEADKEACAAAPTSSLLKDDTDDENYDEFLSWHARRTWSSKYTDYIRYPIRMEVEEASRCRSPRMPATTTSPNTRRTPRWKPQLHGPHLEARKSEVTDEEYAKFYQDKFHDTPTRCASSPHAEGA